jgi:hypothetical protein
VREKLLDPVITLGLPVGVEGRVGVAEDIPLEDTAGVLLPEPHPETLTDAVEL